MKLLILLILLSTSAFTCDAIQYAGADIIEQIEELEKEREELLSEFIACTKEIEEEEIEEMNEVESGESND